MNGWLLRAVRIGQFCLRVIVPLAVLLALGVVLIFFLFPAADLWFVWKVYRRFVDTVANTTGFNSYLVMAGALLGFVLFYRGVSLVLYSPFNRRKRWLGIGILLVLAVAYNLTLYAATKDASFGFQSGTANKYYAITPTGVRFYDRPGVDTSYGIPLQPVTPENIRNLELLRRGEFVPVDPLAARFFNPITGAAELWFTRDGAGPFTFYDKPGYDPKTGATLQPVTHAVYLEWKKAREDAEQKRREALSEQARREEDAAKARRAAEERRTAAELECRIEAERRQKAGGQKSERSAETPRAVVYELPGGGYITSAWGIATSSFTNARPSYTDALYEKCVREALK